MNVNHISTKAIIYQWLSETGRSANFNEEVLATQIMDALSIMEYKAALKHAVALIDVQNFKGKLPKGLKRIDIVMYNAGTEKVGYGFIKEAIIPSFDGECDYKITGEFPEDCDTCGVVISHKPLIQSLLYPFSSKFRPKDNTQNKFLPMKWATHSLAMKRYHLQECVAPEESYGEYSIDKGFIHTNFPKGQILISYFTLNLDDDGYLLIPDDSRIITALVAYLEYMAALKEYRMKKESATRIYFSDMRDIWIKKLNPARSAILLSQVDLNELSKILVNLYKFDHPEHFWKDYTQTYG